MTPRRPPPLRTALSIRLAPAAGILLSSMLAAQGGGVVESHLKVSATQGISAGSLSAGDQFASAVAPLLDLNGDGTPDLVVGAPGDDDGGSNRGALWILFLGGNGKVGSHQKISASEGGFLGTLGDEGFFGHGVTVLGDVDGDGLQDVAVGAHGDDDGGPNRGAVWILFLNADGTVKGHQKISSTAGGFVGALADGDLFGFAVGGIGDLDGDGVPDLAVGAVNDDDGGPGRGAVWNLLLNADGTVRAQQKVSSTAGGFGGALDNGDAFGSSVGGMGDFDHDGMGDLVVGAPGDDDGGSSHGAVWLLYLNADGTVQGQRKISGLEGGFQGVLARDDHFGGSVSALTDLNGDGVDELVVGTSGDDAGAIDAGSVWILFLGSDGTVISHRKVGSGQGGFGGQLEAGDLFGLSVTALPSIVTGGIPELVVGAGGDDDGAVAAGAAWILFLTPAGQFINAGSGVNPQVMVPGSSPPTLGSVWDPLLPVFASAPLIHFLGFSTTKLDPGILLSIGEVLIDVMAPNPFLIAFATPGSSFQVPIPTDPNLIGAKIFTQGGMLSILGPVSLANGVDIVLGP